MKATRGNGAIPALRPHRRRRTGPAGRGHQGGQHGRRVPRGPLSAPAGHARLPHPGRPGPGGRDAELRQPQLRGRDGAGPGGRGPGWPARSTPGTCFGARGAHAVRPSLRRHHARRELARARCRWPPWTGWFYAHDIITDERVIADQPGALQVPREAGGTRPGSLAR